VLIDSRVMLLPTEERGFKLAAELDVELPSIEDSETAADLVRAAHKVCPVSNAIRGNVEVEFRVNGSAIELE
jgi:osmotically inducible protein OsmC